MKVEVEVTNEVLVEGCETGLLFVCFAKMIESRNGKIKELRARMERYEKKRAQEQAAYHNMSAFRKWLSAKTPDHHLAVEQTVYIKLPMEEIEKLNAEVVLLHQWIRKIEENTPVLSIGMRFKDELCTLYGKGGGKE